MSQAGIQALMEADKKATELVASARREKTLRLKQARDEAAKDVKAYRDNREAQFATWKAEHSGDQTTSYQAMAADTERQIKALQARAASKKADVSSMLLAAVQDVDLSLPEM